MEFLTFQYGTATIVMFYCKKKPSLFLSLSFPVIKPGHFRLIYDYKHSCQHWKAENDADSTWSASCCSHRGRKLGKSRHLATACVASDPTCSRLQVQVQQPGRRRMPWRLEPGVCLLLLDLEAILLLDTIYVPWPTKGQKLSLSTLTIRPVLDLILAREILDKRDAGNAILNT